MMKHACVARLCGAFDAYEAAQIIVSMSAVDVFLMLVIGREVRRGAC